MNIEDFEFGYSHLPRNKLEIFLINKENKNKYTLIISANSIPPPDWIFDRFLEDRGLKNFFIDV